MPCIASFFFLTAAIPSNDFAAYLGRRLTNQEKLEVLEKHYKPLLTTNQFPIKQEYGKQRSFRKTWFDEYRWLAYSAFEDGAYCKVCAMFCETPKADRLVKSPLTFWMTATEKFRKHEKSEMHINSCVLADSFIKVMKSMQMPISEQLSSAVALQVKVNKEKSYSIIDTIVLCGRQNIPLRGHQENDLSGNFRNYLNFVLARSGDCVLKNHLETAH